MFVLAYRSWWGRCGMRLLGRSAVDHGMDQSRVVEETPAPPLRFSPRKCAWTLAPLVFAGSSRHDMVTGTPKCVRLLLLLAVPICLFRGLFGLIYFPMERLSNESATCRSNDNDNDTAVPQGSSWQHLVTD